MKANNFFGLSMIASVLIVTQYILAFFVYKISSVPILLGVGWGTWLLSLYLGVAPIFIFRQQGGVAKGQSYVKTTHLVDTNLYAIVRHPQYVAGMLFSLAMMILSPHWLVITLGLISMVLIYLDLRGADEEGIEKFGDAYRDYIQRVPRANFLLGFVRWLKQRRS